eukprot:432042_1
MNQPSCSLTFSQCASAQNIRSVLHEFNKIIGEKHITTDVQLATKLIHVKLFSGNYSNITLLNDFFHIKDDHNTNDDILQFNLFYKFLAHDNDLTCDTRNCKGYNRHYRTRDQLLTQYESTKTEDNVTYSYNLLSRIHTFFIHRHDTKKLTEKEIHNTEIKDNELSLISEIMIKNRQFGSKTEIKKKYVTSETDNLDYTKMSAILNTGGIEMPKQIIEAVFEGYHYDKKQLINDICDNIGKKNENNTLLIQILSNDLQLNTWTSRQKFLDLI